MLKYFGKNRSLTEVKITAADIPSLLKEMNREHVRLYNMLPEENLSITCRIPFSSMNKLRRICKKQGAELEVIRRAGYLSLCRAVRRNGAALAGLTLILLLFLFLPTRIFFIRVVGNQNVPTARILEAAEQCGVHFAAGRREIRSESLKNALLDRIPQLQWACINTKGCTAEITVREKPPAPTAFPSGGIESIIAYRDSILTRCTPYKGTLLSRPGQAVRRGQVLISGYTDCGSKIRGEKADGEVFGYTMHEIRAVTPDSLEFRKHLIGKNWTIFLAAGKKRIKIWGNSGNPDARCGRMYKEYYITLPGGYRLPFALCMDLRTDWETVFLPKDKESVCRQMSSYAEHILQEEMIAGRLLKKAESCNKQNGVFSMEGRYLCHEMIGRPREEKIGE